MLFLSLLFSLSFSSKFYQKNDLVIAYVNKIGPEDNPLESYSPNSVFFFQSLVKPKTLRKSINDIFFGNNLQDIGFHMKFQNNIQNNFLTEIALTNKNAILLENMLKNKYWVQLSIDDLPCWYHIGKIIDGIPQIYQKIQFEILYNDFRIIEAKVSTSNITSYTSFSPSSTTITYSVVWKKTDRKFNDRESLYVNEAFFKNPIHRYSLINSFLLCFLLIHQLEIKSKNITINSAIY